MFEKSLLLKIHEAQWPLLGRRTESVEELEEKKQQTGGFVIRRAEDKDIPELMRILVEVNMVHHKIRPDLFKGPATKYSEQELKTLIRKEEDPIFVCPLGDGKLAGYIFCQTIMTEESDLRTGIRTLYIDDLCVDEACRGHHVAERLYHHAIDYAKATGCYNVTLHVWGGNEGAEEFYRKMGLKPQYTCLETIL